MGLITFVEGVVRGFKGVTENLATICIHVTTTLSSAAICLLYWLPLCALANVANAG